jgi:transcriptional regulator with XRE-family HTH domain
MTPPTDAFRANLRALVARSGLSMRAFSAALGRDPGYVGSLLDPSRPARARPTPADLLQASDALDIPFTELLELLWDIPRERIAREIGSARGAAGHDDMGFPLSETDRASLADYTAFLGARTDHQRRLKR